MEQLGTLEAKRPAEARGRETEPLTVERRSFRAGQSIVRSGEPALLLLLNEGWAAEERALDNGRRQIVQLFIPGDIIGFAQLNGAAVLDLVSLTRGSYSVLGKAEQALHSDPRSPAGARLRSAMSRRNAELIDHIVRLGRMGAVERLAQVLLSLFSRQQAVGLTEDNRMQLPLTQMQMADHLGISTVHANRVVQELRAEGFLELSRSRATFPNREGLARKYGH